MGFSLVGGGRKPSDGGEKWEGWLAFLGGVAGLYKVGVVLQKGVDWEQESWAVS